MKTKMSSFKLSQHTNMDNQTSYYRESCPYEEIVHIKAEEDQFDDYTNDSILTSDHKSFKVEGNSTEDETELAEDNRFSISPEIVMATEEEHEALDYSDRSTHEIHPNIEIKYEDDIEEEEYDSEDSELMDSGESSSLVYYDGYDKTKYLNPNSRLYTASQHQHIKNSSSTNFSHCKFASSSLKLDTSSKKIKTKDEIQNLQNSTSSDENRNSVLLPIVYATINLPFSQVSRFLSNYQLSDSQLSIIRKVRRQVKNRMYAQNCRKRRVAHIKNLANELQQIKNEKEKTCNLRDELRNKKAKIEKQYANLFNYVMNVLKKRHRNDFVTSSEIEEILFNHEEYSVYKQELQEENEKLEVRKKKLEAEYDHLFGQVFKMIEERERNVNSRISSNDETNKTLDLQLPNMNIANELAILHEFYAKSMASNSDLNELESSVSVDGSRTSENKMNDFMESEISNDSKIDYAASNDYSQDIKYDATESEKAIEVECEEPSSTIINPLMITNDDESWSENSEDDDTDEEYIKQIQIIHYQLVEQKMCAEKKYQTFYDNVLKASAMKETDFLKEFVDYCVLMLRVSESNMLNMTNNDMFQ